MQRRLAAISVAFFLVIAAGSFAVLSTAQEPTVEIAEQNRDHVLSQGAAFTVGGTEYRMTSVGNDSAEAEWTNESALFTATLENNSTQTFPDGNFTVVIPNESDPSSFTLVETQSVDRPTVVVNGTVNVIVEEDGERTLVPRDEYLDDPETVTHELGDAVEFGGNETTVAHISPEAVRLSWPGTKTNTVSFSEGANASLGASGDVQLLAHFPEEGTLVLTSNYEDYLADQDRIAYFQERMNGLWGVVILSSIAAILMLGLAFLPSRY